MSVLEGEIKGILSFGIRAQLRAMVIETRGGAQIGVLEGNMQRLQQEVVDNTGSIDRLHLKVDKLEVGMAEIRAMIQEVLKRLPVVEQPAVQPRQEEQIPHRVQANLGEQIPITPPSIHRLPIGPKERNVLSVRAPNHEVHFNPNQPRFSMLYDDPFEPRPKRLNGGVFLNPIVESLCGLGKTRESARRNFFHSICHTRRNREQ